MKLLVFLSMFAAAAAASAFLKPLSSKYDGDWFLFKKAYHKVYEKMKDEFYRRAVWESNIFFINEHNEAADKGKHSYWLGINEYGDLTHEEFVSQFNGFKGNASRATQKSNFETNLLVEESVDWRERGYVTDVKNQGKCGSCWAFSATGALEGQHFKQTRKLVSLSEQNLVDCSGPEGNNGCHGGLMDQAFEYIKVNKGIDTEESYPYEAVEMDCRFKESAVGATDIGFTDVESGSETALKQAAGTVGPISVAINAALSTFRFYKSGVYYGEDCSPEQLDHGVLVVGYGNDQETGKDYWLVKNSWGTSWGEGGYIKMSRNRDNNCGIASKASYPVVRNLNRSDG